MKGMIGIMHIIIEEKQTFYFTVKFLPSSFTTVLSVLHMPSGDLSQAMEQASNDDHEGVDRESLLSPPDETQEDKKNGPTTFETVCSMCSTSEPRVRPNFVWYCDCCRKGILLYMCII